MKILIVEDEEILVRVLEEKFLEKNLEVAVSYTGDKVLPLARKFKPDIILLDIMLPKLDGIEVLKQLKADDELCDIPVIMLSNLNDDENIKRALSLGALDYMTKIQHPLDDVVEKVEGYISKDR